jgi:predicted DCC family thiol-disulfide oxidoreductase YuxK
MTSNNKVMVYDDNCPLCNAYTSAFIKIGLLEANGRQAFSEATTNIMYRLDAHKSRNEIPLLDTVTNETWYGLDAMLEVISAKYPLVKKLANIAPIKWFLLRLYKLISYNRKVIVAVPKTNSTYDCTPDFNSKYRLSFLLIVSCICSAFISPAYQFFSVSAIANISLKQVYLAVIILWLIIFIVPKIVNPLMAYHYWGQLAMLCLISILLTLPLMIIGKIVLLSSVVKGLYVLCLLAFVIKEALRRRIYLLSVIDFSKRPLAQLK